MQLDLDTIDKAFHFVIAGGAVVAAWVAMKIKSSIDDVKLAQSGAEAKLVEKQNEIKLDLNIKHAENTRAISVHQAEDKAIFEGISRTLTRIDSKLDRLSDRAS